MPLLAITNLLTASLILSVTPNNDSVNNTLTVKYCYVSNSMEQSPSREAKSHPTGQEIAHNNSLPHSKNPTMIPILRQTNPANTLMPCFIHSISILHFHLSLNILREYCDKCVYACNGMSIALCIWLHGVNTKQPSCYQ